MKRIRDLLAWAFGWRSAGAAPPPPAYQFGGTWDEAPRDLIWDEQARDLSWDFNMKTLKKRPAESRYYEANFSSEPEIVAGDTLAGTPAVTLTPYSAAGGAPTISTIAIVTGNRQVSFLLSGGDSGNTWLMKCAAHTAGGSILEREGFLNVKDG